MEYMCAILNCALRSLAYSVCGSFDSEIACFGRPSPRTKQTGRLVLYE